MGQMLVLGSYPIHYHMALDVAEKNPLVKSNSIHDTFSRVDIQSCYEIGC